MANDSRVASLATLLYETSTEASKACYHDSTLDFFEEQERLLLARGVQYAAPCECPSDHVGNQWHTPACQKQGAR